MFRKIAGKEEEIMVVVYVDDILAHTKGLAAVERFAAELGRKFKLKGVGDAKYYMRCHITRDHEAHEFKLDQRLYVKSIVKKFGVKKASRAPVSSEVPTLSKEDEPQTPEGEKYTLKFPYREAVGAVMWVATMTRPNIASAVRAVARFCENPRLVNKKAVLKVMKYLLHTKEWGITYGG